jgi:hypothetical protein
MLLLLRHWLMMFTCSSPVHPSVLIPFPPPHPTPPHPPTEICVGLRGFLLLLPDYVFPVPAPCALHGYSGSHRMAEVLIPIIERAGGRALVRADVSEIVMENGAAVGVRMVSGVRVDL